MVAMTLPTPARLAPGEGRLAVARGPRGSAVERAIATSPLKLLAPKNHGGAAWIFVATYGGGLVDGDRIALAADVGDGADLVLSTQASTKVYRSPRGCSQQLTTRVGAGGLFAALPAPVVCFAGARYRQDAAIELSAGASLVWLDGVTAGRAARGERWAFSSYRSRLRVAVGGAAVIDDAVALDPAHGPLLDRMGRFDALATIVAIGPRAGAVARDLLAVPAPSRRRDELLVAASPVDGGALVRIAGVSAERVARAARGLLTGVLDLLGDDPFRAAL